MGNCHMSPLCKLHLSTPSTYSCATHLQLRTAIKPCTLAAGSGLCPHQTKPCRFWGCTQINSGHDMTMQIPRFAFEKFPGSKAELSTQMKSVGEAMAMGRTFQESMQKALRSLETGLDGWSLPKNWKRMTDQQLIYGLRVPNPDRMMVMKQVCVCVCVNRDLSSTRRSVNSQKHDVTGIQLVLVVKQLCVQPASGLRCIPSCHGHSHLA